MNAVMMRVKIEQWWQSPAVRGLSFMSLMRYGTKAFSVLRLILIARLLGEAGPYQLGTWGIALLVIAVTEVFTQTGINLLLLKDRTILEKYLNTAWIISIARGFLISALIWALIPWLTRFYGNQDLVAFLRWALLIPILRGFINPAIIKYQQDLQFGKESIYRLGLQLLDLSVGLIIALILQSALGLLIGVVVGVLVEMISSFVLFKPWPSLRGFNWSLVRGLFKETKYIIVNGMVTYLNENLDDILIGRLLGTSGLGFYQMAYKFSSAVTIEIGNTLRDTLYPIYAQKVRRPEDLLALVEQVQWRQIFLYTVLLIPGMFLARPLIGFFMGEQWTVIVPALQILLLSGALRGVMNAWSPIFILSDKVSWSFVMNSLSTILMVVGLLFLAPSYGLFGAAFAILISVGLVAPLIWQAKSRALELLGV
jgi:lipopolysaccharide exporter